MLFKRRDMKSKLEVECRIADGAEMREDTIFRCQGENNVVEMADGANLGSLGRPKIDFMGSNNRLIIEEGCKIKRGHYRFDGDGMTIRFGRKTTVNGAYILCGEGANVSFGEDCMLSYEIEMRTTDAHSILDAETGKRVNAAADIVVGDHVWIGKGVCILPGVTITDDVIIGMRALVAKDIDISQSVVGGVPAKILTTGRTWDRRLLPVE